MPPKRKLQSNTTDSASSGKGRAPKKVYGKAPELPEGEILTDYSKKQWRLSRTIGTGGFGRIYLATKSGEKSASFVIKMEPASNGPLFQETHVYQRAAKEEMLRSWKKQKGLKFLGIPSFVAAGQHEKNGVEFRFLVLPRLGIDLDKHRSSCAGGRLEPAFVFRLVICCLDSLEYLHSAQYVHADVKGENLLATSEKTAQTGEQFYLVDYGLARKVADQPVYKEAPKKAHDGTLIFTSLDAHRGVTPSYRGDVEILGYNIFYWLTGSLPWMKVQNDPQKVFEAKEAFSKQHKTEVSQSSLLSPFVTEISEFFRHVYSLEYADKPDYDRLRQLMRQALTKSSKRVTAAMSAVSSPMATKVTPRPPLAENSGTKRTTRSNGVTPGKVAPLLQNFVSGSDSDSANTSTNEDEQLTDRKGRVDSSLRKALTRPGIKTKMILAVDSPSPSASSSKVLSPRSIVPGKANLRRCNAAADAKRRTSILVKRKYLTPKKSTTTSKTAPVLKKTSKPYRISSSDEDGE